MNQEAQLKATPTRSGAAAGRIADIIDATFSVLAMPSASQAQLLERLRGLRDRLAAERFQLAVLGQFKRGKSTLLNALLGAEVLPTSVLPTTAISTFIQRSDRYGMSISFLDGHREDYFFGHLADLRERLAFVVTEDRNPRNEQQVARVDVSLPSSRFRGGVVLIDTPGIGSSLLHNTEMAEATLPECDAALFVVSPDPPITAAEVAYLRQISASAQRVIFVMNKIDLLSAADRPQAISYLRKTLAEQASTKPDLPIFAVCARSALAAEVTETPAHNANGMAELVSYLDTLIAHEKQDILVAAIRDKARRIVAELLAENKVALAALRAPIQDLEQRLVAFDEAAERIGQERERVQDIIAGDRRRVLEEIEHEAEQLRSRGERMLKGRLDAEGPNRRSLPEQRGILAAEIPGLFEAELARVSTTFKTRLEAILESHQERAAALLNMVRSTAQTLTGVTFPEPENVAAYDTEHEPYWVTAGAVETLIPRPQTWLHGFLPNALRRRKEQAILFEEIDTILRRNVENLRWATRQNVEDGFRRFAAALDRTLDASLKATHGAMRAAYERRSTQAQNIESDIDGRMAETEKLSDLLDRMSPEVNDEPPTARGRA